MGCCQSTQRVLPPVSNIGVTKQPLHESQFIPDTFKYDDDSLPAILPCPGFQVELGSSFNYKDIQIDLENREYFGHFYRDEIYSSEHLNFISMDNEPIIVSIQNNNKLMELKAVVRTRKCDLHISLPQPPSSKTKLLSLLQQRMPELQHIHFKEVKDPNIRTDLAHLEDRLLIKNYKFGIIYCKEGQQTDDEMFSNEISAENPAPEFEDFLNLMGERIRLKDWTGFDGELDVKSDTTGAYSVFTRKEEFDIMFHVSTMLPYSPQNKQQIERKRHIGNDIVCIVFQDGDGTPFNPTAITSKYNHVYIVVQVVKNPQQQQQQSSILSSTASDQKKKTMKKDQSSSSASSSSNNNGASSSSTSSKESHAESDNPKKKTGRSKHHSSRKKKHYNHHNKEESLSEKEQTIKTQYRVAVASKKGVTPFGPLLPSERLFDHGSELRDFLLTKAINAERGSYSAPAFGLQRTRRDWLKSIIDKYNKH